MNELTEFRTNDMIDAESPRGDKQPLAVPISLQTYIHAATSDNTRRSYQADILHYYGWGGYLPATTDMLLHYLQAYATTLNPKTLMRRLIAIKH